MITLSEKSGEICERIVKTSETSETSLLADILEYLDWAPLSAHTLDDPESAKKRELVQTWLTILLNVVRKTESGNETLWKSGAVDVLHKFLNVTESQVVY